MLRAVSGCRSSCTTVPKKSARSAASTGADPASGKRRDREHAVVGRDVGRSREVAVDGPPDRRDELVDPERLPDDAGEARGPTPTRGPRPSLRESCGVGAEHDDRQSGMGSPDSDRVAPGASLACGQERSVEDHASGLPPVDRSRDLVVIADGDRVVPRFIEQAAYQLADARVVFDEQHGGCREGGHRDVLCRQSELVHVRLPFSPRATLWPRLVCPACDQPTRRA